MWKLSNSDSIIEWQKLHQNPDNNICAKILLIYASSTSAQSYSKIPTRLRLSPCQLLDGWLPLNWLRTCPQSLICFQLTSRPTSFAICLFAGRRLIGKGLPTSFSFSQRPIPWSNLSVSLYSLAGSDRVWGWKEATCQLEVEGTCGYLLQVLPWVHTWVCVGEPFATWCLSTV